MAFRTTPVGALDSNLFFFNEQLISLTQNLLWERGLFGKRCFWEGFISSTFKNQANMLTSSSKCKFWQKRKKKKATEIHKNSQTESFFQPNNTGKITQIHEAKITVRDMDFLVVTWEYIPTFLILWATERIVLKNEIWNTRLWCYWMKGRNFFIHHETKLSLISSYLLVSFLFNGWIFLFLAKKRLQECWAGQSPVVDPRSFSSASNCSNQALFGSCN